MVISNSWRQAYIKLTAFIAEHSEVEIGASIVSMPQSIRPEFYRLFDAVRAAFLGESLPLLVDEAEALSRRYTEVRDRVVKLLELDEVSVASSLQQFFDKPNIVWNRVLFNPLFDLLKGNIDIEAFEQIASKNVVDSFKKPNRLGYQKWVALSLITLLAPDKAFNSPIDDLDDRASVSEREEEGSYEEEVPDVKEAECLSFNHDMLSTFVVPEIIVHLAQTNQYISMRTELQDPIWISRLPLSDKQEWFYLESLRKKYGKYGRIIKWPDIVIYTSDKLEELALITDFDRFCRPDLIIECREQKDWYEKQGLALVKLHHDSLKPTLGTYIVSREPVPEQAFQELTSEQGPEKQGEGIHILTVGFDQSRLAPIINALMQTENKD